MMGSVLYESGPLARNLTSTLMKEPLHMKFRSYAWSVKIIEFPFCPWNIATASWCQYCDALVLANPPKLRIKINILELEGQCARCLQKSPLLSCAHSCNLRW